MEIMFAIGGFIMGVAAHTIYHDSRQAYGYIDVDHNNQTCVVHVSSEDLEKVKTKKAMFKVFHHGNTSREEQGL